MVFLVAIAVSYPQAGELPNPINTQYGNFSVFMDGAYPVMNIQGDFYSCDIRLYYYRDVGGWLQFPIMPNFQFSDKGFKYGRNTTIQLLNDITLRYSLDCSEPIKEYGTGVYIINENETSADCYENPLGVCNSTDPKFNFDQVCELYEFGEYTGEQLNYTCTPDDYYLNNTACPVTFNPDCQFTQSNLNHTLEIDFTLSSSQPFILIDPTVTFSGNDVEGIEMDVIDNDEYLLIWCDETSDDVTYAHYYTNGTLVGTSDLDASVGQCALVADYLVDVIVLDVENTRAAAIWRGSAGTALTSVFNYKTFGLGGAAKQASIGKAIASTVTRINDSRYIGAWIDTTNQDATMKLFDINANNLTGEVDLDNAVGKGTATISSTSYKEDSENFSIVLFDDTSNDVKFWSFSINFTSPTTFHAVLPAGTVVDTSQNSGAGAVSIDSFDSNNMVIGWMDFNGIGGGIKFATYHFNGTLITGETAAEGSPGASKSVSVSTLNKKDFVIGWHDLTDTNFNFEIWNISGDQLVDEVSYIASYPDPAIEVLSTNTISSICEDNIIVAGTVLIQGGQTKGYFPNGTIWDGTCKCEYTGGPLWNPDCDCPFHINTVMDSNSNLILNTTGSVTMDGISITGFTDAVVKNSCDVLLKNGAELGD